MGEKSAVIVADLGFGDAGKGSIIDFLSREEDVSAVIRFNGGGQAAHNVHTTDGRHHTFSQFGSGTFVKGVRTHLSRFMLIDVDALRNEAEHLSAIGCGNVFARLSVDERARVVTPFHKAGNRLREIARGGLRHGTCGMGIGETMADAIAHPEQVICARDLRDPRELAKKLRAVQEAKRAELQEICAAVRHRKAAIGEIALLEDREAPLAIAERAWRTAMNFLIVPGSFLARLGEEGRLLFEGAQGVLLDEWHGFHPYTTWSTTTFENALTLLRDSAYDGAVQKIGVLRAYFTRHGAGPFPTEEAELGRRLPDTHNGSGGWQGVFRVGWFDLVLARYALAVCGGADALAVTNLDRFARLQRRRVAVAYETSAGARITELSPKSVLTDLAYQETLTRLLHAAVPLYRDVPEHDDSVAYLQSLEQDLGVPVVVESHGPTAAHKRKRVSSFTHKR